MGKKKSIPKYLLKKLKKEYLYSCAEEPDVVVASSILIWAVVTLVITMVSAITGMPKGVGLTLIFSSLVLFPTLMSWPIIKAYVVRVLEEMGYYDE